MNTSPLPDPDSVNRWMAIGSCRMYPPATFFPSDGVGVDKARKICAGCPVSDTCLEHALEHRIEHGVWGGCSERERRRILKRVGSTPSAHELTPPIRTSRRRPRRRRERADGVTRPLDHVRAVRPRSSTMSYVAIVEAAASVRGRVIARQGDRRSTPAIS